MVRKRLKKTPWNPILLEKLTVKIFFGVLAAITPPMATVIFIN
jgi:hypothetical protein